jgi:hypothetical protein
MVQQYGGRLDSASEQLMEELKALLPHRPWLKFPENDPAKTPDKYFEILLGLSWPQLKSAIVLIRKEYEEVLDSLERQNLAGAAMAVPEAPPDDQKKKPRNPNGRKGKESTDENNPVSRLSDDYGNSSTYRIGKLKRDHPDVARRLEAGEFKTVAEAERAAGIGRPKMTPVEKVKRAYSKLSDDEKHRFLDEIQSNF